MRFEAVDNNSWKGALSVNCDLIRYDFNTNTWRLRQMDLEFESTWSAERVPGQTMLYKETQF